MTGHHRPRQRASRLLGLVYLLMSMAISLTPFVSAKVYLCGDSTMAKDGGEYVGWGEYLGQVFQEDSFNMQVENDAIGGRSARTYTTEGRFHSTASKVTKGDYVVIQFGWNDGAGKPDRVDCDPTNGADTECSNGILTFQAYMTNAAKLMQSRGATVIIASQTCPSPPASSKPAGKYADWSKDVAADVGAAFIDHYTLMQSNWKQYDPSAVRSYYVGMVHFTAKGAKIAAEVFAKAFESTIGPGKSSSSPATPKSNGTETSTPTAHDKQSTKDQTNATTTFNTTAFQNGTTHGDNNTTPKKPPPQPWPAWTPPTQINWRRLGARWPSFNRPP